MPATMSAQDIQARAQTIGKEIERLSALPEWKPGEAARFHELTEELTGLEAQQDRLRADVLARAAQQGLTGDGAAAMEARKAAPTRTSTMTDTIGGTATYDAARRTIDAATRARTLPDHAAEKATAVLETGHIASRSIAARWMEATGDPEYLTAFLKSAADPTRGHLRWTDAERRAFDRVEEFRAMSLTDNAGGYAVPFTLDPALRLTNAGTINPIRRVASVATIATDTWNGVNTEGVTASWYAEAAEVTDDAPTLAQPTITTRRYSAFVPISFEAFGDIPNVVEQMGNLLRDSADRLQSVAFWSGSSASNQPIGIETALAGGASIVAHLTGEAMTSPDIYAVQAALPPRWQANASWLAELSTINQIGQFETTAGARLFPEVADGRLLRRPLNEWSDMDAYSDVDAAATEVNHVLVYGDLSAYQVVDRVGSTIELAPMLFHTGNNRPSGQRGFLLWGRVGGDVLVDDAFRVLKVTTAA